MQVRLIRILIGTVIGAAAGMGLAVFSYYFLVVPHVLPRNGDPIGYIGVFDMTIRVCALLGGIIGGTIGLWVGYRRSRA